MTIQSIPDNLAFALQMSQDIEEIARPLNEHFGITSLVYGKNYHDGSEIRLTNQAQWIEHYYQNALYLNSGFEQHPDKLQSGFCVWSHLSHHQPILAEARLFNIDHGMTLIKKNNDGSEFYFLGTSSNKPHVTNLLLNNLEFLHHFSFYFKEQAAKLLDQVSQNRIIIEEKFNRVYSEEQGLPYKNDGLNLHKILGFKKAQINSSIKLSARELSCAKLLIKGLSARLIAEELSLSTRTVETHIERLKEKLNCNSKPALINALNELNL